MSHTPEQQNVIPIIRVIELADRQWAVYLFHERIVSAVKGNAFRYATWLEKAYQAGKRVSQQETLGKIK